MNALDGTIWVLTREGLRQPPTISLPEELAAMTKTGAPVGWIHARPEPFVIKALDDMGLDEVAVKSLRDGPERPRVEEFADHLYISLFSAGRTVHSDDGGSRQCEGACGPSSLEESLPVLRELRLFIGDTWMVSVGHIGPDDLDILGERVARQVFARDRGPSFIAYHVCEWLVESLQPALDQLDGRIDALEDQVVLTAGRVPVQELFGLKRDLTDLRRRVSPLRDVMQRLGSHGVSYIEPEAEVYFRDVHDDVIRSIELLDTYREILSSALDLHLSGTSNNLNRVMKRLTLIATVFMPLSFIAGVFGTNFVRMPFESLVWFLLMFLLMFLSVVAILVFTWRRQ